MCYVCPAHLQASNTIDIFDLCVYSALNVVLHFCSVSALLAMQSTVIARRILSVCSSVTFGIVILSFCSSITFRCCVQTNEDTIAWSSASGRTIPLVSGEV